MYISSQGIEFSKRWPNTATCTYMCIHMVHSPASSTDLPKAGSEDTPETVTAKETNNYTGTLHIHYNRLLQHVLYIFSALMYTGILKIYTTFTLNKLNCIYKHATDIFVNSYYSWKSSVRRKKKFGSIIMVQCCVHTYEERSPRSVQLDTWGP